MNKNSLSFDQYRRQLRRELFLKRLQDNDYSEATLFADSKLLDALLVEAGYQLEYETKWTRKRKSSPLEADISDLNSKDTLGGGHG